MPHFDRHVDHWGAVKTLMSEGIGPNLDRLHLSLLSRWLDNESARLFQVTYLYLDSWRWTLLMMIVMVGDESMIKWVDDSRVDDVYEIETQRMLSILCDLCVDKLNKNVDKA